MFNQVMNCKTCQAALPDLLLDPAAPGNEAARAHLATCTACAGELASLEATMSLLDSWQAPEVSPYFDQKLAVRFREEQASPAPGWFESIRTRLLLIAGGGTVGMTTFQHPAQPAQVSAAVTDLQLLDKNEQALQQVDQLLQDAAPASSDSGAALPQS